MAAITWRNVEGRSPAEASGILTAAGNSFNAGFSTLDKMLQQRNTTQTANWEAQKVANTNYINSRLASARTPEEAAAMADEIATMGKGFGAQVDPNVVLNAARSRQTALQAQGTVDLAYGAAKRAEAEAPVVEAYRIAVLNKDEKTQAAIRTANPGLKNWSAILADEQKTEQGFADRDRTLLERGRADITYQRNENAAVIAETKLKEATSLEKAHAASVQKHRERQTIYGETLSRMAKSQGLDVPVDGQGRIQLDKLTESQYTKLKTMSGNQSGNILQAYEQGDTQVADKFLEDAAKSGQYSPALLEQTRSTLRSAYNTDNSEEKVGRDKANVEKFNAKQTVLDDETRRTNPHVPGSGSAMDMFKRVAELLPSIVPEDESEDLPKMRNEMYKLVTEGVSVGDQKLAPSEEILKLAAGNVKGGWFLNSTRGNRFVTEVTRLMNEPGTVALHKASEGVRIRDRTRAVETILKDARKPVSK